MITSLQLAEKVGKRHSNLLSDFDKIVENSDKIEGLIETTYVSGRNKTYRMYEIPDEMADFYINKGLSLGLSAMEKIAVSTIEQLLGITLEKQYRVLNYRIDAYDTENKIAYEIDEPHHRSDAQQARDKKRQEEIEKELGCTFKRISL